MLYLDPFGLTHAGKVRKNNEDSLLVGEGQDASLFAVADGIGGFEAGEVASRIAVEVLKEVEPSGSVEEAIREANRKILAASRGDEKLSGMGTTVVAIRFAGAEEEPVAEVSHVGDSRAYLLRDGELRPITEDHSLVAELVRSGDLTRAQASEHPQKNLITRALGAEEEVAVDSAVIPVGAGDRLLLCSDGLTDMVAEPQVAETLTSSETPEEAGRTLLDAALAAGGVDNVTVVVVDVKERPQEEERPGPGVGAAVGAARGDTQEMRAVSPEEAGEAPRVAKRPRSKRSKSRGRTRPRSKASLVGRALAALVRGVAAVMVIAALATPFYLWANDQYFLGFDRGDVVIYRGLPYAPLGYELNEEHQRTELREPEVQEPYRAQIVTHELKSLDEAEQVVRDLGRQTDEPGR